MVLMTPPPATRAPPLRGIREGEACANLKRRPPEVPVGGLLIGMAGGQDTGLVEGATPKKSGKFDKGKLKEVEKFMKNPAGLSKAHGGVAQAAE